MLFKNDHDLLILGYLLLVNRAAIPIHLNTVINLVLGLVTGAILRLVFDLIFLQDSL